MSLLTRSRLNRFAAHKFSSLKNAPFDVELYSRLKFGSGRAARVIGRDLADRFYPHYVNDLALGDSVIIPAASTAVPIASSMLGQHFFNRLNDLLCRDGLPNCEWSVIHRTVPYKADYASQSKEMRAHMLAQDSQYFNRDYIEGKRLFFIDDSRITGNHEEHMTDIMRALGITNPHTFVAYCEYTGNDPTIERKLNHCFVKDIYDIVHLSHEPGHVTTTRVVRILIEAKTVDLRRAMRSATKEFIESVYYGAIVNGYADLPEYQENFNLLARCARDSSG